MKYGIALFPSKQLQDKLNSYRKRYDPHYGYIPPHITVKEAFDIEKEQLDTTINMLEDIASSVQPIHIEVEKVSSFHPVNNVIYLKVKEEPNLLELHTKLHGEDFASKHHYKFVPHITIAQGLSDIEHSDILAQLKMIELHHEETIDQFQLLEQLDNKTWRVYKSFQLGKGRA
ncbi:2'-5' RNA ligase [Pullulanibacillus pueri]|uniref:Putative phosphoesterase GCM10007096_25840 n=1 Tax=Pullulanibacillus pueri TaxID=1437324 RepID=A0A8J3EM76_9BACL|nr:2'-5' RNA ligase family protein [Pullulanibacillus pueri]MBM7680615.1 2'-5' RNA ligase [Pullulanibacillus pueri]GGH83932.1 putative phosphoesterase [Pullulanibacillus pueri]